MAVSFLLCGTCGCTGRCGWRRRQTSLAEVDPNAVYSNDLTALMWAAGFGKTDTVRALLAAGAKPQLKDNRGKTAADIAREQDFAETAQLLDGAKTGN